MACCKKLNIARHALLLSRLALLDNAITGLRLGESPNIIMWFFVFEGTAMDPDPPTHLIPLHASISCKLFSWNVAEGERVRKGTVLCGYTQELGDDSDPMEGKLHLK